MTVFWSNCRRELLLIYSSLLTWQFQRGMMCSRTVSTAHGMVIASTPHCPYWAVRRMGFWWVIGWRWRSAWGWKSKAVRVRGHSGSGWEWGDWLSGWGKHYGPLPLWQPEPWLVSYMHLVEVLLAAFIWWLDYVTWQLLEFLTKYVYKQQVCGT